mmetsp:Transcript_24398/g.36198  ORF Transcript_24398/g.36198 Transcript_24398/m.36198 type:complete len:2877 (+) Transcript_24398:149-8779(+)|eukprot:CAMPEP_0194205378 /NCGR_PEP_ID=MMETSP0156-20130528/4660_1 /TAXON_ID=33649 /ORGANISM="Thalassionema nitzschioides, Strain L26-B" /LENGTH=2876 /DNA_ID=CAMNT_0038931631 /DNA_START=58 /DNA_END=8688 /DNA_ORIENTATION=-
MISAQKLCSLFFFCTLWSHHSCCVGNELSLPDHNSDIPAIIYGNGKDLASTMEEVIELLNPILENMTAKDNPGDEFRTLSLRRNLKIGDFEALNKLLIGAVIRLPDASLETDLLFTLKLDLSNIRCTGLSVGDAIVTYARQSNQNSIFTVDLIGLDLTCYVSYGYDYGFLSGDGEAEALTDNNSAKVSLRFESSDFDSHPPTNVDVVNPNIDIKIEELEFKGGIVASIVNIFKGFIKGTIESEIEEFAKSELTKLGDSLGDDMLKLADEFINPYLEDLSPEYANPLHHETELVVPNSVDLLNFQEIENELGNWATQALDALNSLFGQKASSIDPSIDQEIGINGFLRDNVLDETGALIVDIDDLDFATDGVIYDGHDMLTQTKITLDSVKVYGLDTFTKFDPLLAVGKYTLTNNLTLSFIDVEVTLTTDIRPSTLPDSIIQSPGTERVIETFKVNFRVDEIKATLSILLAIDQLKLGNLKLSSFFSLNNLIGCLISGIFKTSIVGFDVRIGNVRKPSLDGFLSRGIDRVASNTVEALFDMYETVFLQAVPNIFQTTLRDIINEDVIDSFLNDPEYVNCSSPSFEREFIDFRDFLLSPEDAIAAGGSGEQEFGNIGSMIMGFIEEQLFKTDNSGSPAINSVIIGALTGEESDAPGSFSLNKTLFEWEVVEVDDKLDFFVDRFKFAISNLRLLDLDIITDPFRLLYPTDNPYVLSNMLNIGPINDRALTLKIRFLVDLEGEGSPMAMDNEFDIIMKVPTSTLTADFLAKVKTSAIENFPMEDILNVNCWLATLPNVMLDDSGRRFDNDTDIGFGISSFLFDILDFSLDADCVTCTSPGTVILPDLIKLAYQTGAILPIQSGLKAFVNEVATSDWLQMVFDRVVYDGPRLCPHNPAYLDDAEPSDFGGIGLPNLTRGAVSTVVTTVALAAEIAIIVFAERHLQQTRVPTDPLSGQVRLDQQRQNFLNFMHLSDSFFTSYADTALDGLRNYLNETVEDEATGEIDMRVNSLLRDYLFGDKEGITLEFEDEVFTVAGVKVRLRSLVFNGVDSINTLKVLEPIAAQTLQNKIRFDYLSIDCNVELTIIDGSNEILDLDELEAETLTVSITLEDVELDISLLIAMNEDILGAFEIGSLLHVSQIFPCIIKKIHALEMTQMAMSIGNFRVPTIEGFLADEVIAEITETAKVFFETYQQKLVKAVPLIIDDTLRVLLNGALWDAKVDRDDVFCNTYESTPPSSIVDFRDLLLESDEAKEAGGSGDLPYGSLLSFAMDLLRTEFMSTSSSINEELIGPVTESVSGVAGSIVISNEIANIELQNVEKFGLDVLGLKILDARFDNLDTVGQPFSILEPNTTNGQIIDNAVTIGVGAEGMSASVSLLLESSGHPILATRNEIQIGVDLRDASFTASLLAQIREKSLMTFPLGDFLNIDCWLATLIVPELNEEGIRIPSSNPILALEYLSLALDDFRFNFTCTNCTSDGLASLPDIVEVLNEAGASAEMKERLPPLALEVIESNFTQILIDRMIMASSRNCPHSPNYVENYKAPAYGVAFPELSRSTLDTLIFGGAIAIDLSAVLIALSHQNIEANSYPLSGQDNLSAPTESLLDFSSLGKSIGDWADTAIDELNAYLGEEQKDLDGPHGDSDLGINILMRSLLLDETQKFVVEFDDLAFGQGRTEVKVEELRVFGIDSFTEFKIFDDIAPQTLLNTFALEQLSVELDISILSASSPLEEARRETLTLSFSLSGITFSAAALVAIYTDRLGAIQLGSLMDVEQLLPCLLTSAHNIELTELSVEVSKFDGLNVVGYLPQSLEQILSDINDMFQAKYGNLVLETIPKFFGVTVRTVLNNWASYYLNMDQTQACPNPTVQGAMKYIDFRDLFLPAEKSRLLGGSGTEPYGDLVRKVAGFMNDNLLKINETDGTAALNGLLIDPLTKSQSGKAGTLRYDGDILDSGSRIDIGGFQANFGLKVSNARIESLNTVGYPLSILDPIVNLPYVLNNTASIGIGGKPLRFAATILFFLKGDDGQQLSNEVDISVDLSSATIVLEMLLKISEQSLIDFPLKDITNLNCWLATIPAPKLDRRGVRLADSTTSAELKDLFTTLSEMNLNIKCISCSSPKIAELATLLSTEAAVEDFYRVGTNLLDYAIALLGGEFLQLQIDRTLDNALRNCPHRKEYVKDAKPIQYEDFASPENEDDIVLFLITLAITAGCLICAILVLMAFVKCIVVKRNRNWVQTLSPEKVMYLHNLQEEVQSKEKVLNRTTKSMFAAREIPLFVRLIIPIIILGNIAFFLSGHLSLGGTVNVDIHLGGNSININDFFEFSIAQSTLDIWRAGGKGLAILMIIFSGVWPYTKQLVTLFLWFAPTRMVTISRRGSILLWLDSLAKWSMIDIFVLILSLVAFRISIQSPELRFLPEDFYSVELMVVPMWGLYANMIAQLISQVSSHFIIHYHRRIVHAASDDYEQKISLDRLDAETDEESDSQGDRKTSPRKDLLRTHNFARPHRGEKDRVVVKTGTGLTLGAICVTLSLLLTAGSIVPSFSVEILGLVGIIVESGQQFQQAINRHSIISIVRLIMEEAYYLGSIWHYIGLGSFSFILVSTVVIVPITQALCIVGQWFSPMNQKQRWRLSVAIESLQAWQYVEVYLLAIIVAAWQLGSVSTFMINSYCDSLTGTFALLAYYNLIEESDAQCFKVSTGIEYGTYILVGGAVLLALMNTFVMKAVKQYERDQSSIIAILEEEKMAEITDFSEEDVIAARQTITPPPVMFTDTFRWVLLREDRKIARNTLPTNEYVQSKTAVYAHSINQKQHNSYRMGQSTEKCMDQGVEKVPIVTGLMNDDSSYDLYGNHRADSLSTRSARNREEEGSEIPRSYTKNSSGFYVC